MENSHKIKMKSVSEDVYPDKQMLDEKKKKFHTNQNLTSRGSDLKLAKRRLSLQLQVKFLQRFTELIENGFAIIDALEIMETFIDKQIIRIMRETCEEGRPFSDALERLGFLVQIIYIIRASEEHNALGRGLVRAREFSVNFLKNRDEISKKMRYPLFLFSVVIITLTIVSIFFMPRLNDFYTAFGVQNESTTISNIMGLLITVCLILTTLVLAVTFALRSKNNNFQIFLRRRIFRLPVLEKLTTRLFSYYFASQIEMFIGCGLSFKDSLTTIQKFDSLPLVKFISREIEQEAMAGKSVEDIFQELDCFTPYFRLIATHSLRIGKFDIELKSFVATELTSLNLAISSIIKVVQGGMLALVGILIALLYMSILQPVFDLITII